MELGNPLLSRYLQEFIERMRARSSWVARRWTTHPINEASKLGISMIYQELNMIPDLTVAENIFVNREYSCWLAQACRLGEDEL